ncbi:hypothetical protein ACOSQ2_021651 [Xanthoceras sorbifolium]
MQHIELLHTIGDLLQWTLDTQALYKFCWTQLMMLMQYTDLLLDQGPSLATTVLAEFYCNSTTALVCTATPSSFAQPRLARSHSRAQFARTALPRANRAQPQRAHLAQPQRPAHRRSPSPSFVQIHLRMLVRKNILQIQQYSLSAFVWIKLLNLV